MHTPKRTEKPGFSPVLVFLLAALGAASLQYVSWRFLPSDSPLQLLLPVIAGMAVAGCFILFADRMCGQRCSLSTRLIELESQIASQQTDNTRLRRQSAEAERQAVILQRQIAASHLSDISVKRGEAKFQAAFHATPDPILVADLASGMIIDVNESYLTILGKEWSDVLGERLDNILTWDTRADRLRFKEELTGSGMVSNLRATLKDSDNQPRYFLISARTLELEGSRSVILIGRDVTDVEALRSELARKTGVLESILRHIPYYIFWKNQDHKYMGANELFRSEALGMADAPIEGKTDAKLGLPHLSLINPEQEDKTVMETGIPVVNRECSIYMRSGRKMDALISKVPLRDDDFNIIGILGIMADVSNVRQYERQFSLLINGIPDPAWLKDAQGRYRFANKALAALCNMTPETMTGLKDEEFLPAAFSAKSARNEQAVMQTGRTLRTDESIIINGKSHWYEIIRQPFVEPDMDGTAQTTGVMGIARDISERRAAETEIRKLSRALEQSSAAVVVTSQEGTIEYVNPRYTEITGYTQQEVQGKRPPILESGMHDVDPDRIWKTIRAGGQWRGELLGSRKNLENCWLLASISPVFDDAGTILHAVMVLEDITAKKEQEEYIRHMAMHDGLTDLPNRRLFMNRLKHAVAMYERAGTGFALVFIDLNNFKEINDTYGHDAGDTVIKTVARRLTDSLRGVDTAARLGGDEFVAILHDVSPTTSVLPASEDTETGQPADVFKTGHNDAVALAAQRISDTISRPISLVSTVIEVNAAIGIAICPVHGTDPDTLLNTADHAMYRCKKRGCCHLVACPPSPAPSRN